MSGCSGIFINQNSILSLLDPKAMQDLLDRTTDAFYYKKY